MGMYTEIVVGVSLKRDAPKSVIERCKSLVNGEEYLLRGGSYYFPITHGHAEMRFDDIKKEWELQARSNIKNYGSEIEDFFEWIAPYVDDDSFMGYSMYEEADSPTLWFSKGGVAKAVNTEVKETH